MILIKLEHINYRNQIFKIDVDFVFEMIFPMH